MNLFFYNALLEQIYEYRFQWFSFPIYLLKYFYDFHVLGSEWLKDDSVRLDNLNTLLHNSVVNSWNILPLLRKFP